jgi:hypothetical protein
MDSYLDKKEFNTIVHIPLYKSSCVLALGYVAQSSADAFGCRCTEYSNIFKMAPSLSHMAEGHWRHQDPLFWQIRVSRLRKLAAVFTMELAEVGMSRWFEGQIVYMLMLSETARRWWGKNQV